MIELNCINDLELLKENKWLFEASFLGLVNYQNALEIQVDLGRLAIQKNTIFVLGLHHPEIITLGRRASELADLSLPWTMPAIKSSRGGLATIHSENQLVIYPILNLRKLSLGVRNYVSILLSTTQDLLKDYKIDSKIDLKSAGLYTENGKIAFCGIQIKDGITRHGLSLNVRNDLSLFSCIRSCGIKNMELDRLQNYQVDGTLEEIFKRWTYYFKKNLKV